MIGKIMSLARRAKPSPTQRILVVEDNDDQREMPEGRYVRLAIKCTWLRTGRREWN